MQSTPREKVVDKELQKMWIIWFVFLLSLIQFGGFLFIILKQTLKIEVSPFYSHPMFVPLLALSLGSVALAFFLPKKFFKPHNKMPASSASSSPKSEASSADYFTAFIIRIALFESVAILGLILGLITQNLTAYSYFALIALLGYLKSQPSKENLKEMFGA